MSHVRRSVAAAGCALLLWLLPAAGQEPATSTKELIAELTGLSGVDRGLRAEERPQFGKIDREPSHDLPYVPGKVLVRWRPSREPADAGSHAGWDSGSQHGAPGLCRFLRAAAG